MDKDKKGCAVRAYRIYPKWLRFSRGGLDNDADALCTFRADDFRRGFGRDSEAIDGKSRCERVFHDGCDRCPNCRRGTNAQSASGSCLRLLREPRRCALSIPRTAQKLPAYDPDRKSTRL